MVTSSTLVQCGTSDRNNSLEPPTFSANKASLHVLCANCAQFCERWEALDCIQNSSSGSVEVWQCSPLCTVAHLTKHQTSCHLCKFILAAIEEDHKNQYDQWTQWKVYLRPVAVEPHGYHVVNMSLADAIPTESSTEIPVGGFKLTKYGYTDTGGFTRHFTARTVPLLPQDNYARAKEWLQTCLSQHKCCGDFHANTVQNSSRRPTRVLEVTTTSARLRCNMTNRSFEYLALSHMWGDQSVEHLELRTENLEDFQEDIPWHRLSSTYKEAIHVTIELGYRYLWIDSLCIIQKDDDDWCHEASLMATVYGNATCNLAFIFPTLSSSTTTRSDPRIYNPCVLRAATPSSPGVYIQRDTKSLRTTYQYTEYYGWLGQHHWPLFSRAWTFQEYLLCPRTLLLGHRNLMWQCSAFFYDELLGPIAESLPNGAAKQGRDGAKSRYFPMNILQPGFAAYVDMSDLTSFSFMKDWQNLLDEYRSRELTEAQDRVVAFAGIARAFTNLGSLTYLAGTWAEFFPLCLLWYVDKKRDATILYAGPKILRDGFLQYPVKVCEEVARQSPSWSQFNVPRYTHHQTYFIFNDDEIFVRQKSLYERPRVCWDDLYWADLDSFQFSGQPKNYFPDSGFFDFSNLSATLDLPVLPVKVSWPAHLDQHFEHIRAADPLEAELAWRPEFTYYPDSPIPADEIATPPRRGVLALIAEFQVCRVAGRYLVQRRFAGLVLVRAEQVGTWRRVGAWKLTIKISGVEATPDNIQDTAARWKHYRIWTIGEAWKMETVTLV